MSVRGRLFVMENYWSSENEGELCDAKILCEYKWVEGSSYIF